MKKTILITAVMVSTLCSLASAENVTLRRDRVWKYELINEQIVSVKFSRDSVAGGKEWMVFRCEGDPSVMKTPQEMLLREEDRRIYRYAGLVAYENGYTRSDGQYGDPKEYMLYDFNMKRMDKYPSCLDGGWRDADNVIFQSLPSVETTITVFESGESQLGNQTVSSLSLSAGNEPVGYTVYETVGPVESGTIGDFIIYNSVNSVSDGDYGIHLIRFHSLEDTDGNVLVRINDIPAGADQIDMAPEEAGDGKIYDLMGREIRDPQPGTVYICNGKKYVRSTKY